MSTLAAFMPASGGICRCADAVRCGCRRRQRRSPGADGRDIARRCDRQHPRLLPRLQLRRRPPRPDAQRRRRLVRDEQRRPLDDDQERRRGRLQPRLLVDSHQGYQGAVRTGSGCTHGRRSVAGIRDLRAAAGVEGARSADDRDQRQLLRRARPEGRVVARYEMQFTARRLRRQHPRPGQGQRGRHRHARLRGQAGTVRRQRALVVAGHHDPSGRQRTVRRYAQGRQRL